MAAGAAAERSQVSAEVLRRSLETTQPKTDQRSAAPWPVYSCRRHRPHSRDASGISTGCCSGDSRSA
ncbi:MAG: hypothetical protein JWR85_3472 [Marmoricola sp.]|nr:hypothetical protein [Marmoricola sp.]